MEIKLLNGGGMYNTNSSPSIVNSTFNGNKAISNGGGIRNYLSSTLTIYNSVFYGNGSDIENSSTLAQQGGTIFLRTMRKQVSLPWMQTPF